MSKEDFNNLTTEEQEVFLDNGGIISSVEASKAVSATAIAPDERPAALEVNGISSDQPVSSFKQEWTEGFDFKDPIELLFFLDDDIASGRVFLHKWQIQFMVDFANDQHTKEFPYKAVVRACNGSGKDKYIVAACVVWLCMRYKEARGVVTNGSGVQLDNQTEAYIKYLCERANHKFAPYAVWKCNYRYYECLPTKSPIVLFATDEPNKAEGYHPLQAGAKMAIFASEAKAIPDSIFTALTRCTGYTHRVDVSTPGPPVGYFYDECCTSVERTSYSDIKTVTNGTDVQYHITAFDCPHITDSEIRAIANSLPGGELNPVYKSAVLAEFSSTDEMIVIPYTYIHRAVKSPPQWTQEQFNKAGLDLSDGGAETVLIIRNGNKHIKTIPFKFEDTQDTLDFLEEQFRENNLNHKEALIYADMCGMGKPMLDSLKRRGWSNIRYVDSRNSARQSKVYLNRGTELFFNVRLLLERTELIVQEDKVLMKQLSTRYYKINQKSIHQLLTKLEQRSRGYPSPDRADAFNLAFWDYKSTKAETYVDFTPSKPMELVTTSKPVGDFSLKKWSSNDKESLSSFRRNVSKRQPIDHLQKQLDRYISTLPTTK